MVKSHTRKDSTGFKWGVLCKQTLASDYPTSYEVIGPFHTEDEAQKWSENNLFPECESHELLAIVEAPKNA